MRLFQALFRRKGMPNGNIYSGKQRLIKTPTWRDMQSLRNDFAIEENNMFLLRHPYLTEEQSFGHAKELGKSHKKYLEVMKRVKPFKDNVTIESRLSHLRFKEPWD